ncbi:MAG: hypothetical protein ACSHX6_00515 [Akkermansiaceae bacterium]
MIAFLHSDVFRDDVAMQVSAKLGTEGAFGDFKWDGLSAENESFEANGEGAISSVDAGDISLDVELDYIKRDKFSLTNVHVNRVDAEVDLRREFLQFEIEKKEKGFFESLLPEDVELLDAEIGKINATVQTDSGEYRISGMSLQATRDDDAYNATIEGGLVNLPFPFLRTASLVKGEIIQLDEEIYVKDTKLKIYDSGEIILNGDVDLSPRARHLYDMSGVLTGLKCKDVFPDGWHRHLTGEVRGKFKILPHEGTEPKITGWMEIQRGTLQALPILNTVSYYLAEPKYRTLSFEKFTCDYEKFRDQIHLRNIILSSKGLLKIEGDLKIDGSNLDGLFDVGVPASYLSKIPGAKASVFKPGKDQLLWTKVKIGGDFDDVTEDLSDRLMQAATEEMIRRALAMGGEVISPETINKLIEGGSEVKNNLDEVLKGDKGVLEGGVGAAKGLLDGITGSKKKEKDGEEDEEKDGGGLIPNLPNLPDVLPFL